MRATIICTKGSALCDLYIPFGHVYNPVDDKLSPAAFADKLAALGYEVNGYENVSLFNKDQYRTECNWINYSITAQIHNGYFIPNLLENVEKLTINHSGHGRLAFSKRQIPSYKI